MDRLPLVLLACAWLLAGCRPSTGSAGDRPPTVTDQTPVLATFDPVATSGTLRPSLAVGTSVTGPSQPSGTPAAAAPLPAPAVVDYGPTEEASTYPTLQVRFNRPMVPFGARVVVDPASVGLRIEPPIAGALTWAEPTRLVFEPAQELPLATEYTVALVGTLAAVDGATVDLDLRWRFATPGPRPELWTDWDAEMDDDRYHWKARVALVSDQPLSRAQVREHVRAAAVGADGVSTPIAVEVREVPRDRDGYRYPDFWISPVDRWPADAEVLISLDERLRGRLGPRPVGYPTAHSFRTARGLSVEARECVEGEYDEGCELGPVVLYFNAPIRRSAAAKIRVSPQPPGFGVLPIDRDYDAEGRARDSYRAVMVWGRFERDRDYTVAIDDGLRDVHGQPLVDNAPQPLRFVEPPPSLALDRARGSFPAQRPALLGIESRHVQTVALRVARLDDAEHERLLLASPDTGAPTLAWPQGVRASFEQPLRPSHTGSFGWASEPFDLRQVTGGKPATLLVEAAAASLLPRASGRISPEPQLGLVQITDLGLTAVGSLAEGVVRVARLQDDAPVAGAQVELIRAPGQRAALGQTDADGLLKLPPATELGTRSLLRARKGDDQVVLAIDRLGRAPDPDGPLGTGEAVRATIMTERPLIGPGERVRVLGWSAIATPRELAGLRALPSKTAVVVELRDPHDELVATATVRTKAHGKFWATLTVPEAAALGHYTVTARLLGATFTTSLQVKQFPTPAFEVSATADQTDVHAGEATRLRARASYYFGGSVPITRVRTQDTCVDVDYRPPGLDPRFDVAPRIARGWGYTGYGSRGRAVVQRPLGPDAARGEVGYELIYATGEAGQTQRCTHSVAIADVSEQEIGAEAAILVHPDFYLAADAPRMLDHGEDAQVDLRTLDFDGAPVPVSALEVVVHRRWSEPEYVTRDGERQWAGWREREQTLPTCTTSTGADGLGRCSFAKLAYGRYTITITGEGDGYQPRITRWLWVSAPRDSVAAGPAPATLTVEVDQPEPVAGQPVRATVRAPWPTGAGLLLLAKGGLHEVHPLRFERGQAEVVLTASDAWIPGVKLHALAVRPGDANTLPKLELAKTEIGVDEASRRLAVSVRVQAEAQTRASIPIEVVVRDALGQPVSGHVSVWAVDEAVLSLAPLRVPDLVTSFVVGFGGALDVVSGYPALLRPFVVRPDPYAPREFEADWQLGGLGLSGYGRGGGGSGYGSPGNLGSRGGGGAGLPQTRSQFDAAPIFVADAELGPDGVAQIRGELPDNLTTFRIVAVASAPLAGTRAGQTKVEARFGSGDARVRVTRPLVVRAAMPRVMRPGDLAEIGVVVDNLRGGAGVVELGFTIHDGDGVLELLDPATREASVEAGGQLRVPFRVRATTTGSPQIEVSARLRPRGPTGAGGQPAELVGGQPLADALRLPLPVEAERTATERVAVYGSIADDGAALLPFVLPADADPRFGGLSVAVGSSLLGGVEDAAAYLIDYPYGCAEQTASSLLPLVALGQLARDYPLGVADLDGYVAAGVARLRTMQLPGGGFSYWPGGTEAAPYASAYATWVLHQAAAAGYAVPASMLAAADRYLQAQITAWQADAGPSLGRDIEAALMLASLAERGQAPAAALTTLHGRRQRLPVFAQALLLIALERSRATTPDARVPELLAALRSVVDEREAVAKVEVGARWTWYWDSSVRSSALVLLAMLAADPEHPLVAKLVRGLLEARRGGRWANTQENAYALVALARYAAAYEAEDPRFTGRMWLGNVALATIAVEGRSFDFAEAFTPMAELQTAAMQADERLILERAGLDRDQTGAGRMYYRIGLEWASTATDKPAKAEGIRVSRVLRGDAGPLAEDPTVTSGSLLAFDVELEVHAALDHVAVEVPLPAGLEAVDVELGKGSAAMILTGRRGAWVSHQELRRDRALLFADHLEPGRHTTTVFLRATTPGEYLLPAASAEQMYYPEVYGRTTAQRLTVR